LVTLSKTCSPKPVQQKHDSQLRANSDDIFNFLDLLGTYIQLVLHGSNITLWAESICLM
jgi:hypothetical protein